MSDPLRNDPVQRPAAGTPASSPGAFARGSREGVDPPLPHHPAVNPAHRPSTGSRPITGPSTEPEVVLESREPDVPDPVVNEVVAEELAIHSPDGRPAAEPAWRKARGVLMVMIILGILVLAGVLYFGGPTALVLGLVYLAIFAGVSFPVWYSAIMRKREKQEAEEIVRQTLAEEQSRREEQTGV